MKTFHLSWAAYALFSLSGLSAATFEVTNLDDTGAGSLRAALEESNASEGPDTIVFSSEASDGTIRLNSRLPKIETEVSIVGPGADRLTISGDSDDDGSADTPIFRIAGRDAVVGISGVTISHGLADDDEFFHRQRVGGGLYASHGSSVILSKVAVVHCEARRIDRNDSYVTGAGVAAVYSNIKIDSSLIAHNTIGDAERPKRGIGAGSAVFLLGSRDNEASIINSTISNNRINLSPGASSHSGSVFISQARYPFHPKPIIPPHHNPPHSDDDDDEGDDDDDSEGDDDDDSEGDDDDDSEGDDDDSEGDDDDDSEGDDDDGDGKGKGKRSKNNNSGNGDLEDGEDDYESHQRFFGHYLDGREYHDDDYDPEDFQGEDSEGDNDGDDDGESWHQRNRFVVTIESCTIADNSVARGCAGISIRNRGHKVFLKNNLLARNTGDWRRFWWGPATKCNFHQRGGHRHWPRTFSLGGNLSDDLSGVLFLHADGDVSAAEGLELAELADNGGPTLTHAIGEDSLAVGNAVDGAPSFDQRCLSRDGDPDSGAYEFGAGEVGENTPPELVLALPDLRVALGSPDNTIALGDHFDDAEDDDSALLFSVNSNSSPGVANAVVSGGDLVLSFLSIGTTEITVMATDTGGLSAVGSFSVEVVDETPPVISGMPADIEASCGELVTWEAPTATDNVGVVSLTSTHQPGTVFPLGPTTVIYTATDAAGNSTSESFTVTASDSEAPVISGMPGDLKVCPDDGAETAVVNWAPPTASDDCGEVTLSGSHAPGDTFPSGLTVVTYTATDTAGNPTQASFTITVVGQGELGDDTEPPVFTGVPGHIIENTDPGTFGAVVTWDPPTATDDVCLKSVTCTHDSGSFFCVGTTIVCCTALDHAGNSTTVCWKVTVKVGPGEMLAVATVDTAAPGTAGNYTDFTSVFLTDSGAILMEADVDDQAGLWTADCGDLGLVALKGDAVPGGAGTIDNFIFTFMAEETEEVAFKALIAGVPAAQNEAQFYFDGTLSTVAQSGMTDPNTGAPILRFGGRGQSLNRVGEYFYQADLVRGGDITGLNDNVIFSNLNGIVVRDGDALPAIPGTTFSNIQSTVSATKSGALGFNSFIRGAPRASNVVLVTGDPSNLQVAAREGDQAPGTPAGVFFARFTGESINESAEVAFVGQLVANAGLGVTSSTDNGVWTDAKGAGLQYVVREGDQAPVLGDPGVTIDGFEDPLITDNGIVYVKATVIGAGITATNNDILYAYLPGIGHQIVLHEGAAAPGTGGGIVAAITSYAANGFGNLACTALLKVGVAGVTDENDEALWIYGGLGDPELLMRKSDTFELSPGDERIVNGLLIPTRNDAGTAGRSSAISDANIGVIVSYSADGGGIDKGIFILGACPPHPDGF